jgi:predicted AlkP superfamily phosphohydrolase/phosphomutase
MHTLIIGLDAFEPETFERLYNQGLMPNLGKYVEAGGYSRFSISNPAQSEVSWTSIATGANPGVHGMFDFVHRDPLTYNLNVSLLPTKKDRLGTQFIPPHNALTIFEEATRQGYPATSLWWPATFPARMESPVQTIPGLGTPDILGFLGVGTVFTCDAELRNEKFKTRVEVLQQIGKNRYSGSLKGPEKSKGGTPVGSQLNFQLELTDKELARLNIGKYELSLKQGDWSPILEISFKLGAFFKVHAITRVILTRSEPDPQLYFLPLQIHPLNSPWRYGTPPGFIKRTWKTAGPFLTLGWPQDTTALEEKWIDDGQFLKLCDSIIESREQVFTNHLRQFDEGLLAIVFDTLDRIQHMFWKDRKDIIDRYYQKLDGLVGRAEETIQRRARNKPRLIILSDHGFCDFNHKVHLNRWLIEQGYLSSRSNGSPGNLKDVDWSKSQAYAVGLNSLYFNLVGRETQGCLTPGEVDQFKEKISNELQAWVGPDDSRVVQQVYFQDEALSGPYSQYGPDVLIGYSPGNRASAETGLGGWKETILEKNNDHWSADHCVAPEAVPGVLLSNQNLATYPQPSYRDIPSLAIDSELEPAKAVKPPATQDSDDQKVIEERMKGLGYF